jgi:hypothetical protein
MPYRYPAAIRGYIIPLVVKNFTGGLNLRDSPSEIADNETPSCENITINARGGVVKRLGLKRLGAAGGTNAPTLPMVNIFYWQSAGKFVVQDQLIIKTTTDFTNYTTIYTMSSLKICTFVDFLGKLVMAIPSDGIVIWDGATATMAHKGHFVGTTWTDDGPTTIRPTGIAAWQNKVWVIQGPTFYASQQGDPTKWAEAADTNTVYEKDSLPLTAIGGGQGMDISGRSGLLIFKADSTYRINESRSTVIDPSTSSPTVLFGTYSTLHNRAGAAGPLAVTTAATGQVCFICQRGIFITDGVNAPIYASEKLEPFFTDDELNYAPNAVRMWSAGTFEDRVVFSVTRGSSTSNNYTLEYRPSQGWIVPHSFGCTAYTENLSNQKSLYGLSSTFSKVFDVFKTGADDGAAITARWQSRWFEPFAGYKFRMRQMRLTGRGTFSFYTKDDFIQGYGTISNFSAITPGSVWGTATWGVGIWGPDPVEAYQDFWSLGVAKSVSFEVVETSTISAFSHPLNDSGTVQEIGSFALYGIKLDTVRLGYV